MTSFNEPLRIYLTTPSTTLALGPFKFDPIATYAGRPLSIILAPFLERPSSTQETPAGSRIEVYPLNIPAGTGADISLPVGALALFNDRGLLRLTVPRLIETAVLEKVKAVLERGPEYPTSLSSCFWLRVTAGWYAEIGLGLVKLASEKNSKMVVHTDRFG
jgi:hypothetical protein